MFGDQDKRERPAVEGSGRHGGADGGAVREEAAMPNNERCWLALVVRIIFKG